LAIGVVQTCVVHLIRNTFRYASRKCRDEIARDLPPVYSAASDAAAKDRFVEFRGKWGTRTRRHSTRRLAASDPAGAVLRRQAQPDDVPFGDERRLSEPLELGQFRSGHA
jgi:mutator family transposase